MESPAKLLAFCLIASIFITTDCYSISAEEKIYPPTADAKPQVINGYILPPEPDQEVNNGTLLGVDSNGNGVRDDVEIYITQRFQNFQNAHIDRAIAMQYARATQIIIQ